MGTLDAPPLGNPQQGGDGSGNSGKTGSEGAAMRTMKTGEALQRLQCARVLTEIYATLDCGGTGDIADSALTIAREAAASLVPPKPRA